MKSNNIVSIYIIGNNNADSLKVAFDSLLEQSNMSFEIIFRDNNSADNSYELAIEYSALFKSKGVFMSVYCNKENYSDSDTFSQMQREAEGLYLYFLYPVVRVNRDFIEKVINTMDNNMGALICSKSLKHIGCDGFADKEALLKEIVDGNLKYYNIVYNRMCAVALGKHYEVFLGYNHLYRLFISAMVEKIYCVSENWTEISESDFAQINYDNLMAVFEKYRLIIAMKRKTAIFGQESSMPSDEFIRNSLGEYCNNIARLMEEQGKKDIAYKYNQIKKVFDIV